MCGVLAAPVPPTIKLFIHPSSISLPSGGDVWDTGHLPGLVGSRAHQSASPVPLCFAQKQAPARWVSSRFQPRPIRGEKKEERRKKEVGRKERRQRGEEEERMVADARSEEPRENGSLDAPLRVGEKNFEIASGLRIRYDITA